MRKVKIKTWEDMEKEYGLSRGGNIDVPMYFTRKMERALPESRIIEVKNGKWKTPNTQWYISEDMIEKEITQSDFEKQCAEWDKELAEYKLKVLNAAHNKRIFSECHGDYWYKPVGEKSRYREEPCSLVVSLKKWAREHGFQIKTSIQFISTGWLAELGEHPKDYINAGYGNKSELEATLSLCVSILKYLEEKEKTEKKKKLQKLQELPVDTLVEVVSGSRKYKRYLKEVTEAGHVICFNGGATSKTTDGMVWKYTDWEVAETYDNGKI